VDSTTLRYGLAGAALVDLAAAGRIDVVDGKVVVRDPSPIGTPYLDDALRRIADDTKQRKPHWWVDKLSSKLQQQVLDVLVARGWLRRKERKVLGIFPADRYPGVLTGPEETLRMRLRSVVLDGAPADADLAALIAVAHACGMEKKLFPDLDRDARGAAKARMKEISEGDWAGTAVKRAIDEMQAAVMVAVTAASAGAVAASSS
jgi:Golgi phosphoprotein 3 (GPP34)